MAIKELVSKAVEAVTGPAERDPLAGLQAIEIWPHWRTTGAQRDLIRETVEKALNKGGWRLPVEIHIHGTAATDPNPRAEIALRGEGKRRVCGPVEQWAQPQGSDPENKPHFAQALAAAVHRALEPLAGVEGERRAVSLADVSYAQLTVNCRADDLPRLRGAFAASMARLGIAGRAALEEGSLGLQIVEWFSSSGARAERASAVAEALGCDEATAYQALCKLQGDGYMTREATAGLGARSARKGRAVELLAARFGVTEAEASDALTSIAAAGAFGNSVSLSRPWLPLTQAKALQDRFRPVVGPAVTLSSDERGPVLTLWYSGDGGPRDVHQVSSDAASAGLLWRGALGEVAQAARAALDQAAVTAY